MVNVRKSWDTIASHYSKRYKISHDVVHYGPLCSGEDKLYLLGNISGRKVIDLGCGAGQNVVALAKMGAKVTGVDFSEKQLEEAGKLARSEKVKADFVRADLSDLSYINDNRFDMALSACAVAYIKDIRKMFDHAHRILKAGGRLILSDMNPLQYIIDENNYGVEFNNPYPFKPITLNWDWEFDELGLPPEFRHYVRSISEYVNTLIDSGFEILRILEPKPTLNTPHIGFSREIIEEYPYIAKHIPITFIIKAEKR